jgi:hypothetical protein
LFFNIVETCPDCQRHFSIDELAAYTLKTTQRKREREEAGWRNREKEGLEKVRERGTERETDSESRRERERGRNCL